MPEMHLRQPQFTYSACDHLLNINKELKSLKKLAIKATYNKINQIRLVLLMMQHIPIVKILQKEQLQIKF